MPTFNLLDEPWLTLRPLSGGTPQVHTGRQALIRAADYAGLVVEQPTHTPALLRQFFLPIVWAALGPPRDRDDWLRRFREGHFTDEASSDLAEYLREHHDRFDLFHAEHPFAQVAGLRTAKDETKGAALLVATAATGNNVPLFASRTEGDPLPLTPAEAAHWLLHTHCWDTAAIKTGVVGDDKVRAGKTTGNPTGPLGRLGVVTPLGRTLYDTILLNLPHRTGRTPDDEPQWARDAGPEWNERAAKGLLDLWTWQSRRIRLVPEETPKGPRVTRVVIAAGDRLGEIPDYEPHTTWSLPPVGRKPEGPAVRRPRRHQPGKAAWRSLDVLLESTRHRDVEDGKEAAGYATSVLLDQLRDVARYMPAGYPIRLEMTGISYGTQSAVVDDVLFDTIPLPLTALPSDGPTHKALLDAVDQAEELARGLNHLSGDLRRAAGAEPIPWDKGQRPGESLLHALDPAIRRLLRSLRDAGEEPDRVEQRILTWEQLAWRHAGEMADQVVSAATPAVFAGRTITDRTTTGRNRAYRLATADDHWHHHLRRTLARAADTAAREAAERPEAAVKPTEETTMPDAEQRERYWDTRIGVDGRWRVDHATGYVGPPPGADLAAMRTGLGPPPGEAWEVWAFCVSEVDERLAHQDRMSPEQRAEHAALALFGLHQQAQSTPMHKAGVRPGQALRALRTSRRFNERAVDRRVDAAATAAGPEALRVHLRGLVTQLRTAGQPLDYNALLEDLREFELPDGRRRVRRRWGRDYYGRKAGAEPKP
ncbi:type I-E CRISPR-associated protein Cse1/CasA [Embleya sp. NPDC001921]